MSSNEEKNLYEKTVQVLLNNKWIVLIVVCFVIITKLSEVIGIFSSVKNYFFTKEYKSEIISYRLIPTQSDSIDLLELTIANKGTADCFFNNLTISGTHPWGRTCSRQSPENPWQEVYFVGLNSEEENQSYTLLNSTELKIDAKVKLANCGDYKHRVEVKIPIQEQLSGKESKRYSYLIHSIKSAVKGKEDRPPYVIKDWNILNIYLDSNCGIQDSIRIENWDIKI